MVISTNTTGLAGNKVNEYKIQEKREVNIVIGTDTITRLCVDASVTGVNTVDMSWCEKFPNVANDTSFEIRTNAEMGNGTNALKKISIFARIGTNYVYDDYLDVFFIIYSGTSEIARTSQASGWVMQYETDNLFAGNLNFKAFNLPVTGIVDVAVVWRNKI